MSISFSLKHAAKGVQAVRLNRARLDEEEEEEENSVRDVPLSGKRKRETSLPAAPKVIPLLSSSDWRQDRKRRIGVVKTEAFKPLDGDTTPPANQVSSRDDTPPPTSQDPSDTAALQALLSGDAISTKAAGPKRIIAQPSEEDMLHHDVDTRPDEPTLHDYQSMPVEEFGAAMLRGMGWREGMGAGKQRNGPAQAPEVKKRAALLGLGAKERPMPTSVGPRHRSPDPKRFSHHDTRSRHSPLQMRR